MEIYHRIEDVPDTEVILTIGTFDGVHTAHQEILRRIVTEARAEAKHSMLITFSPHPRTFVSGADQKSIKLLSSDNQKVTELSSIGLDILLIQQFDRAFSEIEAEDFIQKYLLTHIKPSKIVLGYDHKFGKDRKGDIHLIRKSTEEKDIVVQEISKIEIEQIAVSSTQIRSDLSAGKIQEANRLLGRPYAIRGTVIKGLQNGRKLGYPTANIKPDNPDKLLPRDGVYKVDVIIGGTKHRGALNIGYRPSVDLGLRHTVEVYIIDFEGDIYGHEIEIQFLDFIRPEIKFADVEDLRKQIARDVIEAAK